jgi:pilus assembly protein CpaB
LTRRRWIIIGLAGTLALVLGLGLLAAIVSRAIGPVPAATPIPPRTVAIVVATHDLPIRTLLQPTDVTLIDIPVQLAPREAISQLELAVGRISMIPLVTGEMVSAHHLADPSNLTHDLAFVIGDDQVLMAFPATDLMSRINLLQPGDVVDIFASLQSPLLPDGAGTGEGGSTLFTFSALQQVEISAVVVEIVQSRRTETSTTAVRVGEGEVEIQPQPTPTPQPSDLQPEALLVALHPQDALVLKYIKDAGGVIDIVLRAPTAKVRFELSPVMADYLRDRFELVISR